MDLYTRRQLALILITVLVAAVGLGVDRWRRANPGLAERLETLDRAPAPAPRPASVLRARAGRTDRAPAPPEPGSAAAPVDLNRATRDELQRLPGIGPGLAGRIVDARQARGRFTSIDELRHVRGIGEATLARMRPLLAVGAAP